MSLDKVSIDFGRIFEAGQAYTALSRCTRLANAHLYGLLPKHLSMVNEAAMRWYDELEKETWS